MDLLYFGWVRTKIGTNREKLDPPAEITEVSMLIEWLKERGGGYKEALDDLTLIRIAVNQELTNFDASILPGDEIAVFPPMTGG